MGKKTPDICVDQDPDKRQVARALRGLRAMVRLGKLADKVLKDIDERGYSDERAYWFKSARYNEFKKSSFPRAQEINRGHVPGYDSMELVVGGKVDDKSDSASYESYGVSLRAYFWTGWEKKKWEKGARDVGIIRVTSSSPSLRAHSQRDSYTRNPKRIPILVGIKDSGVRSLANVITECVFKNQSPQDDGAQLRRMFPRWLMEDGTAERWLRELRKFTDDKKTVKKVMES